MKRATFVIPAALVALLLGLAVSVYAYDSSRSDLIADGVRVGGVDLAGMRAAEARAALEEELAAPLSRPVRVKSGGDTFKVSAKQARVRTDVDGMVEDALSKSREGNVLSRTVRDLGGGSERVELASRVTYSERAVVRLVGRVEAQVERPAQDASVDASGAGLEEVASSNGVDVQGERLQRAVKSELGLAAGERTVKAQTQVVKPTVTTDELTKEYPYYVTVDRGSKQLRFYRDLKLEKTYHIAVGRVGFETPSGLYHIQSKAVNAAWHVPEWGGKLAGQTIPGGAPNNPLKARWLGIADGAGIHGTDDIGSLGTAASHGCIRMAIPEVKELYDKVPTGTPIFIS